MSNKSTQRWPERTAAVAVIALAVGVLAATVLFRGTAKTIPAGKTGKISSRAQRVSVRAALTFVVMGDNRPTGVGDPQPKVFARLLRMARREHPAFVLSTGDIVTGSEADPSAVAYQYRQLRKLVRELGVPFYVARGNHDAINSDQFFEFVKRPRYYSFERDGAVFWVLDTESSESPGSIDPGQFEWLRKGLLASRKGFKFVVMHRPVLLPGDMDLLPLGHPEFADRDQADVLRRLFESAGVSMVLEGHDHVFDYRKEGPTSYVISGGAGSSLYATERRGGFHHYVVVKVGQFGVRAEVVKLSGQRQSLRL